jgi:hypothetical protein
LPPTEQFRRKVQQMEAQAREGRLTDNGYYVNFMGINILDQSSHCSSGPGNVDRSGRIKLLHVSEFCPPGHSELLSRKQNVPVMTPSAI